MPIKRVVSEVILLISTAGIMSCATSSKGMSTVDRFNQLAASSSTSIPEFRVIPLGLELPSPIAVGLCRNQLRKIESEESVTEYALLAGDLGIASIMLNDIETAATALDQALLVLTSFSRETETSVRRAKSLFGSESEKLFKGEPHERSLLFMFRGLIYFAQGDMENARACFISGSLEDEFARDMNSRDDWLTLSLLEWKCNQIEGARTGEDLANDVAERIRARFGADAVPDSGPDENIVLLIGLGYPPQKTGLGESGHALSYYEMASTAARVQFRPMSATHIQLRETDNVLEQAQERGARYADSINLEKSEQKVVFERIAVTVGLVGSGGLLGGLIASGALAAKEGIDAGADLRALQLIPSHIYVTFCSRSQLISGGEILVEDVEGETVGRGKILPVESQGGPAVLLGRFFGNLAGG